MNALKHDPNTVELIPLSEVKRITGMGTTFIYTQMAANNFPRQRKIGKRSSRWVKPEVVAWANGQPMSESK